ncbi:hypothetical protein [Tengunoibacter tsumagoiensis]|uniref:Uncharacterized protein n=1 Tax=Tengunoibacter tsumagoiensis TaxID=2014871 RepID=A0A402A3N4_9CHLR|nr:hypothetical protein [Tengunoibacter tsumagoiensis]GCE13659.1 hypothetical protein KTT_35180 [Tengunoibacter tsumagoiensis]
MSGNLSEVAHIRQQIDSICRSMNQALTGYSITAKHTIISNKYKTLDMYHEQLKGIVGEHEAIEIICTSYNQEVR